VGKTLQQLQMSTHNRYLATLNLYRFLKSNMFEEAYNVSTEEEQKVAISYIENNHKAELISWVRNQLKKYNIFEILRMQDLRLLGQELGVVHYATKTRTQLLFSISQRNYDKERNGSGIDQTAQRNGENHFKSRNTQEAI
jgi:hypothetical protein